MSYPAFEEFANDPELTFARWRVFMSLQPPFLSHATAQAVKIDVVQFRAKVRRQSAIDALGWLIRRGYLVVHCRDSRNVPSVTLAYALPKPEKLSSTG